MASQKLAGFLKSHWRPLAVIAIAIAVLAFAAGMLTSNRGAADEPAPDATLDPTAAAALYAPTEATLDPAVVASIYGPPPTNEQFDRDLRELKRRQAAAGNSGENRSGKSWVITITPPPRSTAEARFREAPLGRALYFVSSDKVIFLPEGVEEIGSIVAISCYHENCPAPPITLLKKGEARVSLDAYGNVVPYFATDDPDTFPFLKEHNE